MRDEYAALLDTSAELYTHNLSAYYLILLALCVGVAVRCVRGIWRELC